MAREIFKNQIGNATVNAIITNNCDIQVDISGVLDGADMITYVLNDEDIPIPVGDCSWMSSNGDTLTIGEAGIKYIHMRKLRFSIVNAGASTDLSVYVSCSTGDIKII